MFKLEAPNGEVFLVSEEGVACVKANFSGQDSRLERKATEGSSYFVLEANNREDIGKSEMYSSKLAMAKGIASVAKYASEADTVDAAVS